MLPPIEHQLATQYVCCDTASEALARRRGKSVAKRKRHRRAFDALCLGVPDHEIGVEPGAMRPLRRASPANLAGGAHPVGASRPTSPRRGGLGPDRRQPELQRRDAPQASPKSPRSGSLSARGAGAVVGDHEIDDPLEQRLPERFAVFALADRRGALVMRGAIGNGFGLQAQIMRTRLDRDGQPLGLGRAQDGRPTRRRRGARCARRSPSRRHNPTSSAMASSSQARGRDCEIAVVGARDRVRLAARLPGRARRGPAEGSVLAQHRHGVRRSRLGGVGELVDPRMHQEGLASEHSRQPRARRVTRRCQGRRRPRSRRPRSTALRRPRSLLLERRARGGHRQAVERHVDNRGHPAGGGGSRACLEALPLGAPRLVEVHVAIDEPRGDHAGHRDRATPWFWRSQHPGTSTPRCVPRANQIVAGPTPSGQHDARTRRPASRSFRTPSRRSRTGSRNRLRCLPAKNEARDAGDQARNRVLHARDAGPTEAEAEQAAKRVVVEILELGRAARRPLGELEGGPRYG